MGDDKLIGPADLYEQIEGVTEEVAEVAGRVDRLRAFVWLTVAAWSVIGGIWLYRHW